MTKTRNYCWSVLVGCFLFIFFENGLAGTTVGLFIAPICTQLGFDTTWFSLLYSFSSSTLAITLFVCVPKLDTGNMRRILLIGAVIIASGYALYGCCSAVWQFRITHRHYLRHKGNARTVVNNFVNSMGFRLQ